MKLRILLAVLLATAFAAGEALSQEDGVIRITSDPEATLSDVSFCVGIPTTLHISFVSAGATAGGITGAEFRVDGLPAGWSVVATPNPAATVILGAPFGGGTNIVFPSCQASPVVSLFTVVVTPSTSDPATLTVMEHSTPSNPLFPCPLVTLCDSPAFTKVCVLGGVASMTATGEGCGADGTIRVSTDPEAAACDLSFPIGVPTTLYISFLPAGATAGGITGAEFRVDGLPPGWSALATANPAAGVLLGDPFGGGTNLAFPSCQAGPVVNLFTVVVTATTGDPATLTVMEHSTPSNPFFPCPLVTLCDSPVFTKVCVCGGTAATGATACGCEILPPDPCDPDATPPELEVTLSRDTLWPPNHKLVEVCATIEASDECDADVDVVLCGIWSDEPDDGLGDGNFSDDIQGADTGTADDCFFLRSERQGGGDGRTYTILYCATDDAGNTTLDTVHVVVPHDQSGNAHPVAGFAAAGTAIQRGAQTIRLVIGSTKDVDVSGLDPSAVQVGNHLGLVSPSDVAPLDVDGDGYRDLLLTFPAAPVRKLLDATLAEAAATVTIGDDGSVFMGAGSEKVTAVGLRYEADGHGFLVPDILSLGKPIALPEEGRLPGFAELPSTDAGIGVTSAFHVTSGGGLELRLATGGRATVEVFNVLGQKVRTLLDRDLPPGLHAFVWDGSSDDGHRLGSGVYFVKVAAPGIRTVGKVRLMR